MTEHLTFLLLFVFFQIAVKANCGITIAAYIFVILAALWSFVWAIAVLGTFNSVFTCVDQEAREQCTISSSGYGFLFLLFLAYFFSHQVLQVSFVLLLVVMYYLSTTV